MWEVVLLTGILAVAGSLYLFLRTEQLVVLVDKVLATRWLYMAAFVRLLLGAALIASAHTVRFPEEVAALGWLIVLGGLLLVAVPQNAWLTMGRALAQAPTTIQRAYIALGLLLGGFMVYAAVA